MGILARLDRDVAPKFGPEHVFLKSVPVLFGMSDEALTELAGYLPKAQVG
jgi:hypothetical protein